MNKKSKKHGIGAVFSHPSFWFVVVLTLVLVGLWQGLGFAEEVRRQQLFDDEEVQRILDERGERVEEDEGEDAVGVPLEPGSRSSIIDAVQANATTLLPDAGGASALQRFWFVSETEVYVEYQAGEVVQMAFLEVANDGLARRALYGQAESGTWELIDGTEVLFTKPLEHLYEKNRDGEWVAIN